jgi:hypothetical protein
MSNLPPGSNDDPLAPWNNDTKLCRYCDEEMIREILTEELIGDPMCDPDCVAELVDEVISEYGLCKQCAKEEYYDYDDDY